MQSLSNQELKQIKIDNWGSYFLQRLLQLYFNEEFFDLTIKFHGCEQVLKVHRLIIFTCTNYFYELEQKQLKQICPTKEKAIIIPPDMSYDSIKSIISFIYTGQLSYWTSEQNNLYLAAKKLEIPILVKLLEAQINSSEARLNCDSQMESSTKNSTEAKSFSFVQNDPENKCTKRKVQDGNTMTAGLDLDFHNFVFDQKYSNHNFHGPSRFDIEEKDIEDMSLGVFSSFDTITYNSKPIIQAYETETNIKLSNSYQTEARSNVLSKNLNKSDFAKKNNLFNDFLINDWEESESSLKCDDLLNFNKEKTLIELNQTDLKFNVSKNKCLGVPGEKELTHSHTKIVREVLKKYPYLMQQNKNIKLKILNKESKNSEQLLPMKRKASYIVLKSDSLLGTDSNKLTKFENVSREHETILNNYGPWKCDRCDLTAQYTDYHTYRIHMQDVHGKKFDPRICEYCGFKTSKRNTLMYHMYTKHNISPPKSLSFPKCQECSYIALSKSFLVKHQINHKHYPSNLIEAESHLNIIPAYKKNVFPLDRHKTQTLSNDEDPFKSDETNPYQSNIDQCRRKEEDSHNFRKDKQNQFSEQSMNGLHKSNTDLCTYKKSIESSIYYDDKDLKPSNSKYTKLPKNSIDENCLDSIQNIESQNQSSLVSDNLHHLFPQNEYSLYIDTELNSDTVIRFEKPDSNIPNKIEEKNNDNGTMKGIYLTDSNNETNQRSRKSLITNQQPMIHKKKSRLTPDIDYYTDDSDHAERKSKTSNKETEKINQYVEEETEILEYVTRSYS